MEKVEKNSRSYTGYEYKEVKADLGKVSLYLDCYKNFGWILDDTASQIKENGISSLQFKRDRKIINKQELTRLQRNFEDCLNQIESLEKSKTSRATMYAIIIGLIGTVFISGSVFSITADVPLIWLCVLLGIPGIAGWILPILVYKYVMYKRTKIVEPLIEEKYDEMNEICEKGSRLIL